MKVLHCSTSVSDASANIRMQNALIKYGVESNTLVLFECKKRICNVKSIGEFGIRYKLYQRIAYYFNIGEFLFLKNICGLKRGMPFSWIPIGANISKLTIVKNADVIHVHCINSCYLSLKAIQKLIKLGKPIVITLHDSWFLTGGCHVLNGCDKYRDNCLECNEIKRGKVWRTSHVKKKRKLLDNDNVYFTAPSRWTYENYLKSGLDKNRCCIIGNTLNFDVFKPRGKDKGNNARKIKLLFGALNSVETPYKGFRYLIEMLRVLFDKYADLAQNVELHIFGADNSDEAILQKYECKFWGYIDSEVKMAELYNMCDVYMVPSLEDSFNQTVLESCACETPVVSFRTGGICDIIRHKETGYLAEYKNVIDLLNGFLWILNENEHNRIGVAARKDVESRFAERIIAEQLEELYHKAINKE